MAKQSNRINYMDPNYEMDFTNLDRLPTETGDNKEPLPPLLREINKSLNEQSERLEDIFIGIACENLDNPRKCAFYKELNRGKATKRKKPVVIDTEDDFDPNDPAYLEIVAEVSENPRD